MRVLFIFVILVIPALSMARPLWVLNNNEATIDLTALDEVTNKNAAELSLIAGNRQYQVRIDKVSPSQFGVTSYSGEFVGSSDSFFLLCRTSDGNAVAFFQPGDGTAYRLDHTQGFDAVRQVDYTTMGDCGGGIVPPKRDRDEAISEAPTTPTEVIAKGSLDSDNGSRLDVLIAYTPNATDAMGGSSFAQAEAQLSIDAANLAYSNSGISSVLRLVHLMEVDYDESVAWTYGDHLDALWDTDDGQLDEAYAMGITVGADFVSVLIDGRDIFGDVPTGGIGYVMPSDAVNQDFGRNALSIISISRAATNWSFAHEIGHNRGCAHNREDASVLGAYSFSFGHRWTGFRSVMSYDNFAGDFVRVPHFSNPNIDHSGEATGIVAGNSNSADNAQTHESTAQVCATFKSERTFVEFGWIGSPTGFFVAPYSSLAAGWSGSRDGGTIVLNNSDSSFVGALSNERSYVHVGTGSVVLGGQ